MGEMGNLGNRVGGGVGLKKVLLKINGLSYALMKIKGGTFLCEARPSTALDFSAVGLFKDDGRVHARRARRLMG